MRTPRRCIRRGCGLALAALAALCLSAPAASADFGLNEFDVFFGDGDGKAVLEAGAHPYEVVTSFGVNNSGGFVDGQPRDILVSLPEGFVGDPLAAPPCATADFLTADHNSKGEPIPSCANSGAVGLVELLLANSSGGEGTSVTAPVYNLEPSPGVAAKLGFWVLGVPVTIELGLRESPPYNVLGGPTNISQVLEVLGSEFVLWGVPADKDHDALRGSCLEGDGSSNGFCDAGVSERPFITLPRACRGPLRSSYAASSWQGDSDAGEALTHEEAGNPRGMQGCGELSFSPEVAAQATTRSAESPTGLDLEIRIEDEGIANASGRAGSDIDKAVITLPEGMTANPSQAEGLGVCSEGDLARERVSTAFGSGCPGASKIGTVQAESPLLEGRVLEGSIFIAEPYANRFGTLLALYIVVREPQRGVIVKLATKVVPDPASGRLVAITEDVPQLPVSRFSVHFREGARSPLVSPPRCGSHELRAELFPSGDPGAAKVQTPSFEIDSGVGGGPCPPAAQPFEPGFEAGALNNAAGRHSPFLLRLTRRDGDQDLTRFDSVLPPGSTATLAGVAQCPQAGIDAARANSGAGERAAPSCPAASRIGSVVAGAGVGSALTYVPGTLYLAGPFGGAPLSVVAVVPAVAGPFDVGTVVVRQALRIDPRSARVSVDGSVSEPLPHILAGIPLRVRDIQVAVDRPRFTLNPTSCAPSEVGASIWGGGANPFSVLDDAPVARRSPFQASDCARLGFAPRLGLRLKGGTRRGAFPALRLNYRPRAGHANLRRLVLRFPRSEFIEQGHFRTICTRVQFAAGPGHGALCPKGSIYGRVTVRTPLLDQPLSGPVFLRSSNNNLPDAVLALHGPPSLPVELEVATRIDSVRGGLRAIAADLPDAPVSSVFLRMQGGQKGLFVNSTDICRGRHRASVRLAGQNGRRKVLRPQLRASACKKRAKRRARASHRRG